MAADGLSPIDYNVCPFRRYTCPGISAHVSQNTGTRVQTSWHTCADGINVALNGRITANYSVENDTPEFTNVKDRRRFI